MWVEFVVGSRPCSEGFSPGSPVFLPPQKSTLLNSNSIWKQRMKSHVVEMPLQIPIYLFIYLFYLLEQNSWKNPLLTRIGKFVPVSSWGSFLQSKEKINNKKIPNIRFSCDNEVNSDIIYLFFTVRHLKKHFFFSKVQKKHCFQTYFPRWTTIFPSNSLVKQGGSLPWATST